MVDTGPRFNRSINGESSRCAVKTGSLVIAETNRDGPI